MFYRLILVFFNVLISELLLVELKYMELYCLDKFVWGVVDFYYFVFIWLVWIIYVRFLIVEEL